MASSCPNCGKKLHWYDVKAECSNCGVSIPNFNWEERLEADNELAERKFASFYRGLNRIAYSIWNCKNCFVGFAGNRVYFAVGNN